jgi:MoaA/NifB/PqqE/SkfB family radical SAM enzyme
VARRCPTGIAPVLQVHPTRRCNIACAHCYSTSGPHTREELPLELLSRCLADAVALGYRQLAVSGGEPLLYRPLARLLAEAKALGMVTTVTSNGMLATARRWEQLAPVVDVAAISIDGTPAEHDAIRNRNGAFRRTVANLRVVRASGTPFGLIFTLTQHNVDSLEFVVRLAAREGARSVQVHPLTLHGRAIETMADARPDSIELVAALCEASLLAHELGVAVHVDAISADQLLDYRDHLVPRRPVNDLTDVAPVLVVDADGTVVPMTHEVAPSLRLGSLTDARFDTLARDWLASGRADELAGACARTWRDLTESGPPPAVYWYDEVAARTRNTQLDPPGDGPVSHGVRRAELATSGRRR